MPNELIITHEIKQEIVLFNINLPKPDGLFYKLKLKCKSDKLTSEEIISHISQFFIKKYNDLWMIK